MDNMFKKTVKQQFSNLQNLSEELQVQMALGKAEAKDFIEKERKLFSSYLQKQKDNYVKVQDEVKEQNAPAPEGDKVLSSLENLDKMLYRSIPVNAKGYDDYKNETLKSIYQVEDSLRGTKGEYSWEVQENLEMFKNKMDAFRVNLALHDVENPQAVENVKRNFTHRLEKVMDMINEEKKSDEKLEQFSKDISESYNYLKKAISDLSQ